MHSEILKLLTSLEEQHNVEILYACESGSRAWGFASPDSDYDIRFIYKKPNDSYISVFDGQDTIEVAIENDLDPGGWDIKKALNLLAKSNGALIEWLHSPIVYLDRNDFRESWQKLTQDILQSPRLRHHYLGLAQQISKNKLSAAEPSAKAYLYVLRALLAARWIELNETVPPVPFAELIPLAPMELQKIIHELVAWKASASETGSMGRISLIDDFAEEMLSHDRVWKSETEPSVQNIMTRVDTVFKNLISDELESSLMTSTDFNLSRIRQPDLILLDALSGSHAYGTQTPQSDTDYKGVFIAPDSFHASMESIEQVSDEKNDEVYYELTRFFQLLTKNNPTALELLYSPDDCIRTKHPAFDLIDPNLFLSKLCEKSFSGYAAMQIKKARGLNKKIVNPEPETRKNLREFCHILVGQGSVPLNQWLKSHSLNEGDCGLVAVNHAPSTYALFHDKEVNYRGIFSQKDDGALLFSSVPHEAEPIAWLNCNLDAFKAHCRSHRDYWNWVSERNEDRYQTNTTHGRDYDSKNMMHTLRLLDTALEIATEETLQVRRPNSQWLLEVKNGAYSYDEILNIADEKLLAIEAAYKTSKLPNEPDREKIQALLRKVQKAFV